MATKDAAVPRDHAAACAGCGSYGPVRANGKDWFGKCCLGKDWAKYAPVAAPESGA